MKSRSKKRTPNIVNLAVKRRYPTQREMGRLMGWARRHGRCGHRDATMILVAYRHGLRASEVCDLPWQQIELSEGRLHVHRVKNGIPSVHPIRGDEMRALRKLRRDYPKDAHVFVSERGGPISPICFHRLFPRRGEAAQKSMSLHPPTPSRCRGVQHPHHPRRPPAPPNQPRPHQHPPHRPVHRKGARPLQGLLEGLTMGGQDPSRLHGRSFRSRRRRAISSDHEPGGGRTLRGMRSLGPTAVSALSISRFFDLGGSSAGSAVASIIFAGAPACVASEVSMYSIMTSSYSSVKSLSGLLCPNWCSPGTRSA